MSVAPSEDNQVQEEFSGIISASQPQDSASENQAQQSQENVSASALTGQAIIEERSETDYFPKNGQENTSGGKSEEFADVDEGKTGENEEKILEELVAESAASQEKDMNCHILRSSDEIATTHSHQTGVAMNGVSAVAPNSSGSVSESGTLFSQVAYLGSAQIDSPKSEAEIQKIMGILNSEKSSGNQMEVVITIPYRSDGYVKLEEARSGSEIISFRLQRILFCARGRVDSSEKDCFAFSYSMPGSSEKQEHVMHQCHAFRCNVPEAVGKVLLSFATAFRKPPLHSEEGLANAEWLGSNSQMTSSDSNTELDFQFEAFLEMKEEDSRGNFTHSPQEKNCFKLRRGREKKVVVTLRQMGGPRILAVQKCFGLLLAPGRNVRHSDMHLLDMQSMGRGQNDAVYEIEALWDPNTPQFEVLNTETPRDTRVFMTIAADVVLSGIHDPIRFTMECKGITDTN